MPAVSGASSSHKRDPEATRRKLLEAATAEISERGLDGLRVDQLAASAGVNKRMIYHYFGDKRGLYDAVIAQAAADLRAPTGLDELSNWRAQLSAQLAPVAVRLMAWEGLRLGAASEQDLEAGPAATGPPNTLSDNPDAQDLALMLVALASFPQLCPQLVKSLTGLDASDARFDRRWQRLQRRLLRLIRSAADAPKERVTLHANAKPSVR